MGGEERESYRKNNTITHARATSAVITKDNLNVWSGTASGGGFRLLALRGVSAEGAHLW